MCVASSISTDEWLSWAVQIDHIPPGAVVLIDAPRGTNNAVYGGMMSRRAKARQAAGTVVRGRVRDLKEHWDLEYPVCTTSLV